MTDGPRFGGRSLVLASCATALLAGVVACSGSPAGSSGARPTDSAAAGTGTAQTSVDPNAPEVNAAGDIPDNQVFVPYTPPDGLFRVSVPEGWARRSDGAATVFTDTFNSVRVEAVPRPTAPDPASATAEEVPAIQRSASGFQAGKVTTVTRAAGPAVLITYTASSPADPVTGKTVTQVVERYEFWKDGQEAVLTLSGPQEADDVDPWRTVSDSFAWLR